MPLHEYQCKKCHHRFERIQKFSDSPLTKCPECRGKVEQLLSAPNVQFKGSGWYVNDYGKGGSGKPSSGDSPSKSESTAVEAASAADASKSAGAASGSDKSKKSKAKKHD